jgi:uncharacterized lipoprotein YmbA
VKALARRRPLLAALVLLAASCGPASSGLKPVGAADTEAACPGGRTLWNLEINDQRADRSDSDRVRDLIRQSLARTFPGCQWTGAAISARPEAPTIAIEIHRFAADFDGSMYDAAAEWTVIARSPSGQSLTQFDAEAHVARPNYRGSNNEREALSAAFEQAVSRTAAGLRNLEAP